MASDENTLLLLDVLDKLGYSGEAPGTGDVIQYLAQLLASVGLTSDAASQNGDALQRLAYLVAALGSPSSGTVASALGLTGDAANPAGSANAKLVDIKSYLVNTIYVYLSGGSAIPGLGQQGDAANPTGSINAKAADIKAYLTGTILNYLNGGSSIPSLGLLSDAAAQYGSAQAMLRYLTAGNQSVVLGRTHVTGTFSTTSSSLTNALSISGKGTLTAFTAAGVVGMTASEVKITLDGNVILDFTGVMGGGGYEIDMMSSGWSGTQIYTLGSGYPYSNLDFKSSLLIQIKGDGTHAASCAWGYNQ